jgi:hypothetical protein
MKNLTKKERFENVLAELRGVKGLDVISSYYYDHKNLYANVPNNTMDFDFLDLSIIVINTVAMVGTDANESEYDTLRDASLYAAMCGEIGYYFNNPVIVVQTNENTDDNTVKEIKAIYKTYFDKQGDVAYMEICDMFGINLLGDYIDHGALFDDEFKLRSDLDFLDYKVIDNYGEPYMRKKLIRDVTRQVYNYMANDEEITDRQLAILVGKGVKELLIDIVKDVHKELGSNILDDKIENIFEVYEDKKEESDING